MASPRIVDVRCEPLDLPLNEPFSIASGSQQAAANVLVEVTLDSGVTGLGEAAPMPHVSGETREAVIHDLQTIGDALGGQALVGLRWLADRVAEVVGQRVVARAAIEMALLDASSRSAGVPLQRFWGGRGAVLETDMTITAGDADHAQQAARRIQQLGIRTAKVKVGAQAADADVARMVAIHRACPELALVCDANGGYSLAAARDFLAGVAAAGVPLLLFEQPLARGASHDAWRALRADAAGVLIAADESVRSAADVFQLAAAEAVDAVNLKVMKSGVFETVAMWEVARAAGLELMIGGMVESILAMTFSAQLAAGLGGIRFIDLDTPLFVREMQPALEGGYQLDGGRIELDHISAGHGVRRAPRVAPRDPVDKGLGLP